MAKGACNEPLACATQRRMSMAARRTMVALALLASLSACKRDSDIADDPDDHPKRRAKKHAADERESESASPDSKETKQKKKATEEESPDPTAKKPSPEDAPYEVPADAKLTPAEKRRVERVANRHMGPLMKDARMRRAIAKETIGLDPATAYAKGAAIGDRMARRGVTRLPIAKLAIWSDARLRLAAVSKPVCAGLWTGLSTPTELNEAFGKMDEDDLDAFFEILAEAVSLELDSAGVPLPDVGSTTFVDGLLQLQKKLDPVTAKRFDNALKLGIAASQDDSCAATKVVHGRWTEVDASMRDKFLRSLAIAVAGGV